MSLVELRARTLLCVLAGYIMLNYSLMQLRVVIPFGDIALILHGARLRATIDQLRGKQRHRPWRGPRARASQFLFVGAWEAGGFHGFGCMSNFSSLWRKVFSYCHRLHDQEWINHSLIMLGYVALTFASIIGEDAFEKTL